MISLFLFRSLFFLFFFINIVPAMLRLPSNQRKPPFFPFRSADGGNNGARHKLYAVKKKITATSVRIYIAYLSVIN